MTIATPLIMAFCAFAFLYCAIAVALRGVVEEAKPPMWLRAIIFAVLLMIAWWFWTHH